MDDNLFYTVFAKYYHKIFPINSEVLNTFQNYLQPGTLLDVGTGSGEYAAYFSKLGYKVTGIDLNNAMISVAKARHGDVLFTVQNMLTYHRRNTFLNIICLGSTIAHLKTIAEIKSFIKLSFVNLKQNGVLVIKTLDYTFVVNDGIMQMPTITASDKSVMLKRDYELKNSALFFHTTLITPEGEFSAKTKLFPLTYNVMEEVLKGYNYTMSKAQNQLTIIVKK